MSPINIEAKSSGRDGLDYDILDDIEKQGNGSISSITGNIGGRSITERYKTKAIDFFSIKI